MDERYVGCGSRDAIFLVLVKHNENSSNNIDDNDNDSGNIHECMAESSVSLRMAGPAHAPLRQYFAALVRHLLSRFCVVGLYRRIPH